MFLKRPTVLLETGDPLCHDERHFCVLVPLQLLWWVFSAQGGPEPLSASDFTFLALEYKT